MREWQPCVAPKLILCLVAVPAESTLIGPIVLIVVPMLAPADLDGAAKSVIILLNLGKLNLFNDLVSIDSKSPTQ